MGGWQPIATALKDGTKIDLWAKTWLAYADKFEAMRFPDCYWSEGDQMSNRPAYWVNFSDDYYPTHWMPRPAPPEAR